MKSMADLLGKRLGDVVTQKERGQRAALEVVEEGKRAAAALAAAGDGAPSSPESTVGGGRLVDDVWAEAELPLQEGGGGPRSPAEVAELEARVARAEQAKCEARGRRIFRAQEHAPLALRQVAPERYAPPASVEARPPARGAIPSCRLEEVLLTTGLCRELYAYLNAVEMARLLRVSRLTRQAFDKVN